MRTTFLVRVHEPASRQLADGGFLDLAGWLALHPATFGAGSARASWLARPPPAPSPLREVWLLIVVQAQ